jgi:hypothetical protein
LLARQDHTHTAASGTTPSDATPSAVADTGAAGTSVLYSRGDHVHKLAMASGKGTMSFAGSQFGTLVVTFPAGRFAVAPVVVAIGDVSWITIVAGLATTSGVTISGRSQLGASSDVVNVQWIAVSMP